MFYNVPSEWSEDEVTSALLKIGKIKRVRVKKQFKYQTVRAEMTLTEAKDKEFEASKLYTAMF